MGAEGRVGVRSRVGVQVERSVVLVLVVVTADVQRRVRRVIVAAIAKRPEAPTCGMEMPFS